VAHGAQRLPGQTDRLGRVSCVEERRETGIPILAVAAQAMQGFPEAAVEVAGFD
jgi:hypothetical protein